MTTFRVLTAVQNRIKDTNPTSRATVVAAIRYTFAESNPAFDELLGPMLIDVLSLMLDPDIVSTLSNFQVPLHSPPQTVRRLALSTLNSAARTKVYLIRDHLHTLLPTLYQETVVKPDLIRTVQMGPWTHKVDDGLEARKTAYETLYTLVRISSLTDSEHLLRASPVGHMLTKARSSRVPRGCDSRARR